MRYQVLIILVGLLFGPSAVQAASTPFEIQCEAALLGRRLNNETNVDHVMDSLRSFLEKAEDGQSFHVRKNLFEKMIERFEPMIVASFVNRGLIAPNTPRGIVGYPFQTEAIRKHLGPVSNLIPADTKMIYNPNLDANSVLSSVHSWWGHLSFSEQYLRGEVNTGHELVLVHELVHLSFYKQRVQANNWDTSYTVNSRTNDILKGLPPELQQYGARWSWEEVYAYIVPMLIRLDATCEADTVAERNASMKHQIDDLEIAMTMLEAQRGPVTSRLRELEGPGHVLTNEQHGFRRETLAFENANITRNGPVSLGASSIEISSFRNMYAGQLKAFDALAEAISHLGRAAELPQKLRSTDASQRSAAIQRVCEMRDRAWAAVDLSGVPLSRFRHSLD